jgi:hypothetical protein
VLAALAETAALVAVTGVCLAATAGFAAAPSATTGFAGWIGAAAAVDAGLAACAG